MKKAALLVGTIFLVTVCLGGTISAQQIQVPFHCEKPVAMTSPGYSPEIAVVNMMVKLKKLDLGMESDPALEPEGLKGKKTLIFIIGASGKGMGAAGVQIEGESERAKKLIAECRGKGIKIIGMHLGGADRTGQNAQVMIDLITPKCDYVVIRADGDVNGLFTNICSKYKVPLTKIGKTTDVIDVLIALFRL